MTVSIDVEEYKKFDFDYENIIKKSINGAVCFIDCPYEVEVNVLLTNDEQIRIINKENRNIDKATDVLSFPMLEYEKPGVFVKENLEESCENFNPETGELLLGDIVLSVDRIISQAKEYGHSQIRELAFLVVHSMLHLFGYDHIEESERIQMEDIQKNIMREIDILR